MTAAATAPALADVKPLTRRERSIATHYKRMVRAKEKAAQQYELADRIAMKIAKLAGGNGKTARIATDGRGIQVIDNYLAAVNHPKRAPEEMPKAWAHAAVRQFDFKEVNLFNA